MQSIASPRSFALNAQLQQILTDTRDLPKGKPADAVCWNVGECGARHLTKAGGLPYVPRGFEWPTFDEIPLVFYGQFCFADSEDIVDDLPGDVLLIFGQAPGEFPGYFDYEWMPLRLDNLVSIEDIPNTPKQFKPCHASIARLTDYNTWRPFARNTTEDVRFHCNRTTYPMFFHGTKIGGVPTIVVGDYADDVEPWQPPGRFICQLDSIGSPPPGNWPFLNLDHGDWVPHSNPGFLEFTGHGTLVLYLDDDGLIHEELCFS